MSEANDGSRTSVLARRICLISGPLAALAMTLAPAPTGLPPAGWVTAALAVWMAVWWAGEALPLAATALLPLAVLPLAGVAGIDEAAAPFANPLIFLFLGGFLIALAVQRWGLHRRLALLVIVRAGTRPRHLVGGVMLATAGLSMWISNTATAMMMLPIALSLVGELRREVPDAPAGRRLGIAMLLGVAYAASIGGLGTLIGSPPNALLASFMRQEYGIEIGFVAWMALGLPAVIVLLPVAWLLLTRLAFPLDDRPDPAGRAAVRQALQALGRPSVPEKRVAAVCLAVALAWLASPLLGLPGLTDTGIAVAGALLLFALPAGTAPGERLLDWEWARRAPWEVLLLFGGGLSLAQAIDGTGLAAWLGGGLESLAGLPAVLLVGGTALMVLLLTELTSNTATTAAFLPVVAALAAATGMAPLALALPAALAASCAFMLPVATPPNAIVYGSGEVTIPQMMRAGLLMNLAGLVVVTLIGLLVAPLLG